ncbi:magnesium-translocating P-type ATPase [Patescibacteria group bacterium]|nr:magnesium-translocating P-type ATPase [Patescibacteria group bacterium]MBU4016482.1 magnesium-translocating P-type ATPase [Patescibacteria group bacterium]
MPLPTESDSGLNDSQVSLRQEQYGLNVLQTKKFNSFSLLYRQLTGNPLLIILAAATFISFLLGDRTSSFYIFGVIMVSIFLGFWNEYSAERTVEGLMKKIAPLALVIRNGEKQEIPVSQLTIGDIVLLFQGSIIPADLCFIETRSLEVNESALTGESQTVFKQSTGANNLGFMGTIVESGSGKGVVIQIGKETQFGKIAKSAAFIKPTTEFQVGLTKLGNLIIKFVIVLTIAIFLVNALLKHDILNSVLFALAVAVGITPELLPVIVTVSLSAGAGKLAKKHVVVKRLLSLENLGNIDVLCSDKTGTLTEGKIDVVEYINIHGKKDIQVLTASLLCNNAIVHKKVTGNAIDVALWEHAIKEKLYINTGFKKLYEEEFDYNRKMNFSAIRDNKEIVLITKGAPESIIPLCKNITDKHGLVQKLDQLREQGLRIIAVANKPVAEKEKYSWDDVCGLSLIGYITFLDIPKKTAKEALIQLKNLNVFVKIVTGDNEIVTKKICQEVGMDVKRVLTGPQLEKLSDPELRHIVNTVDIFARVLPLQKLKIIKALQANGHTVGFLGDGINDLPALHNADVGISVNTAVDVAKEAASVVLLRKGIDVINDGIREGRRTFSNTIKYIMIAASSNFGNMFSAAGASAFLPFLPMMPVQILLTNALYDVAQLSVPTDNVDHESLVKPRHWNIEFIKNYMLFFGPLSSIFDYLTFSMLLLVFHAQEKLFQTGWFVESLATQVLIVFVIRTVKKPFYKSKPSKWLIITSLGIVGVGIALPFSPLAASLGFVALPPLYFVFLIIIIVAYLFFIDMAKRLFLQKYSL